MNAEIPFHISKDRALWGKPNPDKFRDVLPLYANGLLTLAQHISLQPCDGVLTLGYSAKDMWADMSQIATSNGLTLPITQSVTGNYAWQMYGGSFEYEKKAFEEAGITFKNPLVVDDFVETARKIKDLQVLFDGLAIPVQYAVLYSTPEAMWELRLWKIEVFTASQSSNQRLFDLLKSRRSPSSVT